MHSKPPKPATATGAKFQSKTGERSGGTGPKGRLAMTKSMHQGVEIWCDCCSCEAEPYWVEAMQDYKKSHP